MKRRIIYFLMVALIAFSLVMPCYAEEVTEATTIEEVVTTPEETTAETHEETPAEEATETVTEAIDEAPEAVTTPEAETPTEQAEDLSALIAELKQNAKDLSLLGMLGTGGLIVLAVVGIVKNKFAGIIGVFNVIKGFLGIKDGENKTFEGALGDVKDKIVTEFKGEYADLKAQMEKYEAEMKTRDDNEQKLYAILTLFFTNVKMPESAKTEILAIVSGVKKYSGDAYEIAKQVQEVIDEKVAEAEAETPETPVLDELLKEEYMELG